MSSLVPIGTATRWGKVQGIGCIEGERYYWTVGRFGIAMLPADVVEMDHEMRDMQRQIRNARRRFMGLPDEED